MIRLHTACAHRFSPNLEYIYNRLSLNMTPDKAVLMHRPWLSLARVLMLRFSSASAVAKFSKEKIEECFEN